MEKNNMEEFSVSLVYTKQDGTNFLIELRPFILMAANRDAALGASIRKTNEKLKGFSLTCSCVTNITEWRKNNDIEEDTDNGKQTPVSL